ncbi:unnamed protein product [Symbiodinium natans]|uniref:Uncharacterized protein n=1 Tax=Symbiodinium natans TaxID=878477 RepID=A0A812RXJ7_9DINO|nr:unnamed protein product [Symbiodinium natans]
MALPIDVTAVTLAGRELAKVAVSRDTSLRELVEELGKVAEIAWDAWQLTWDGKRLGDWSMQPFISTELPEVVLQVVLKAQPVELDSEQAAELLKVLKEPYDGLDGLSFAVGALERLSLGAGDDDACFADVRGDASSGVMSEPQLSALTRAVLDQRFRCTVLCLRGILSPMPMMSKIVQRQDSDDLVSLLSHMPQLTSLDLSGNRLGYTTTCIGGLATAMPKLQRLTHLNLSCNGFFSFHGGSGAIPPHVLDLLLSLQSLTALEVLDFHLNDKAFVRSFGKEKEELASFYLPKLLSTLSLKRLKRLIFSANDVAVQSVEALEAARPSGCDLDFGLEDHVARALSALREPGAWKTWGGWGTSVPTFRPPLLDLPAPSRNWPVRAAYYLHLGRGLAELEPELRQVVKVDLSGQKLGRSWPGLCDLVLPQFPALRELDLSNTDILLDFIKGLHQPAFASLTTMNLAGCGLCHYLSGESPEIATAFSFWAESLTDLDLSENFISEYGDLWLGALELNLPPLLQGLKCLKRFALCGNDIGGVQESSMQLVTRAFETVTPELSLEQLDLRKNHLEGAHWGELLDKLRAAVPWVLVTNDDAY